jgi:hypothetical protein
MVFDDEEEEEEDEELKKEKKKWYNNILFLNLLIFVFCFLFLGIAALIMYFCYPPVLMAFQTSEYKPSVEKDDDGGRDGGGDGA